jgi:hypothetical protein
MQPMSICTGLTNCSELGHGNKYKAHLLPYVELTKNHFFFKKHFVFLWERTDNLFILYFGGEVKEGNRVSFFLGGGPRL